MQDVALSDSDLIQQAAGGDPEAFTTLFDRHYTQVYHHTVALCGDTDLAEDITQMAFLRAHRNLGKFGPPWLLRPWLYRVVRNLLIDSHRRSDSADRLDTDAPIADDEAEPEEQVVSAEVFGQIEQTLLALSPQQRQALIMREVNGCSYQDIAEVLGISMDNVKVVLHRARASFKDRYGSRLLAEDSLGECEELADLLDAFHDGQLSGDQDRIVRDHLRSCERCQQRKRRIAAIAILLGGMKLPQPPPELRGHILELARSGSTESGRGGGREPIVSPPRPAPTPEPEPQVSPPPLPETRTDSRLWRYIRLGILTIVLGVAIAFLMWLLGFGPFSGTGGPESTPTESAVSPVQFTDEPTPSATEEGITFPESGCECRGQDLYCADGTIGQFNPQCTGGDVCTCVCDLTDPNTKKCLQGHNSCDMTACLP